MDAYQKRQSQSPEVQPLKPLALGAKTAVPDGEK
jgi:hypothetical protein